jgi:hypothetical protein
LSSYAQNHIHLVFSTKGRHKLISKDVRPRLWAYMQKGYGAFSVSSSNVSAVIRYIDQQEAHHKKKSFDDEFIALLKKHGVEFDPRYVLD